MKVVAVEEEEERFAEEQTKELSRVEWEEMGQEKREPGVKKEWEGGREEESGRNGEVSEEYLGGRGLDLGGKGLGLGGREESITLNGKVEKEEEGVKKEGGEGENEDREEKKRDCLQSMMKLRLKAAKRAARKPPEQSVDYNGNMVSPPWQDAETLAQECFYCGTPTRKLCQHCKAVYFCSQAHLMLHRPEDYCQPFIVKRDPVVGRYTVASRDIPACQLILREPPALHGPYTKTTPVCLSCYAKVDGSYRCPDCNFPLCSAACAAGIHTLECQFFVSKDFKFSGKNLERPNNIYSSVTLLRMLLIKDGDPDTHARIHFLMDHTQEKEGRRLPQQLQMELMSFLTKLGAKSDFSKQEVEQCIGILRTNGMKLEEGGLSSSPGVVLYPAYCLINHACSNNTNYQKLPDLSLELRSQVAIRKGEEISTRYVSSTVGNFRRRRDIAKYWFFNCQCARCSDPTELGTHMSSIRCQEPGCRGLCSPSNPLSSPSSPWQPSPPSPTSPWQCHLCQAQLSSHQIEALMDKVEDDLEGLVTTRDPVLLEEMIHRYWEHPVLHPNHYLVVELCHSLVFAYAALRPNLSRPQQERVVQICSHILSVLGKVDSGFTQWRGTMLSELVSSLLAISKADVKSGTLSQGIYKRRLYQCMLNLSTAKKCHYQGFTPMTEEGRRGRQLVEEKAKKADRGNMEEKADKGNLEEKEKTGKRQLLGVKAKMHKLEEKKNAQIRGESKYAQTGGEGGKPETG